MTNALLVLQKRAEKNPVLQREYEKEKKRFEKLLKKRKNETSS